MCGLVSDFCLLLDCGLVRYGCCGWMVGRLFEYCLGVIEFCNDYNSVVYVCRLCILHVCLLIVLFSLWCLCDVCVWCVLNGLCGCLFKCLFDLCVIYDNYGSLFVHDFDFALVACGCCFMSLLLCRLDVGCSVGLLLVAVYLLVELGWSVALFVDFWLGVFTCGGVCLFGFWVCCCWWLCCWLVILALWN